MTRTPIDYQDMDAVIVTDMIPDAGVLGVHGVQGLSFSSAEIAFVAACDMPFLDDRFIDHMIRRAENYDIVVPRTREGFSAPARDLFTALHPGNVADDRKGYIEGERIVHPTPHPRHPGRRNR